MVKEAYSKAEKTLAAIDAEALKDFTPRGAAKEIQDAPFDEILIWGPAGTGKTLAALKKIHRHMMTYPGARALITRQTRTSMTSTVLVTFEKLVLGESSPIVGKMRRQNRLIYNYPNGSEVVVGGLDAWTRVMSSEYDIIFVAEATETSLSSWEALTTRLRNNVMPYQQLMGDCNPSFPHHWLRSRMADGTLIGYESFHRDNPLLYEDDLETLTPFGETYMRKLHKLTGHRKERLLRGKWTLAEGVVYEFNELVHLIKRFPIPKDWQRFLSIDFGYRNPFCCNWWAVHPETGAAYRYREIYMRGRLVRIHAEEIKKQSENEKIQFAVCDHDADGRDILESITGIRTVAAKKAISRGIEEVQYRLNPDDHDQPLIYFFKDALVEVDQGLLEDMQPINTVQEFSAYTWRVDLDGKPNKEEPIDDYNHGMDNTRYAMMELYDGRRADVMSLSDYEELVSRAEKVGQPF